MREKNKKIMSKIANVVALLVFIFAMGTFIYVMASKIAGKTPQIFGYSFHFVVTPSMEPDIKVGDFVIGKKTTVDKLYRENKDKEELDKDVILFVSPNPTDDGIIIVHKIRDIIETEEGIKIYTYGINNDKDDERPTSSVIGKVVYVSSALGKVFNPITAIFVVLMIIILAFFYYAAKAFIKNYRELKGVDSTVEESPNLSKEQDYLNTLNLDQSPNENHEISENDIDESQ